MKTKSTSIVWLTFLFALLLEIMPLPHWFDALRPDWVLIVMSYWALALPHRYSVFTACGLGIILDLLLGATIGSRGLAMSIIIYIVALNYQRLRNFPIWQQALILTTTSFIYHTILFWIEYVISQVKFDPTFLLPIISNMLIWPWAHWFLRRIRRHFKVK
tara:strand:+ start:3079 stop:3558 length:480 start_codon:yes stop_codon:yes gene_type:complete